MKVENYTKQNYSTIDAFCGVAQIKQQLLKESAVVVTEEDNYSGIITPYDLLLKSHNLVIDCMRPNTTILDGDLEVEMALEIMDSEGANVLPVFKNNQLMGLVFREDIINHFNYQNKELRKEIANRDKLFSIIAHDLRNPLNYISGFSELLKKNHKNYDEQKRNYYIDKIEYGAKQVVDLAENLLSWALAQKSKIDIAPEKICLKELIENKHLRLAPLADKKTIILSHGIVTPIHVYTDYNMLKTVFRNLITNAIKFTKENGKIKTSATIVGNEVEISIVDNGIGIPKERIAKIFSDETLSETNGTHNEGGTGLGLHLCKEFIELNGGRIWLDPTCDVGCCVKFTLPLYQEV